VNHYAAPEAEQSSLGRRASPKFVNRANRNYRLKNGSPAINQGRNTVPGGLGPLDLGRTARVKGGRVDQGAYESF